MLEATIALETDRSIPHSLLRATGNRLRIAPQEPADLTESSFRFLPFSVASAHLLVIGDHLRSMAGDLGKVFPRPAWRVDFAGTGKLGLERIRISSPDVILVDLHLPEESGLDVYQQIRGIDAHLPVIFVARVGQAGVVIEAIKQGAHDCLCQPLDLTLLRRVVGQALHVARHARQSAAAEEPVPEPQAECGMIGSCPAMQTVYKAIGLVAAQDVPVLITGETGTGKELVARAIYQHSRRAQMPFLALNCAAIPENLLESELFGHEKGAFTGADRRRIGKFEQCHGGTIFLDEIGDMPLALQARILRLLQNQTFERVGGNETIRTNVRVIAASHRDLKAWSADGQFRPDLYYRLGVFCIHLPPLRERGADLPLLVRHQVRRLSTELGRQVRQVAPEAMDCLCRYSWPGNVRELESVLKQALLQASGPVLLPEFLPELLGSPSPLPRRRANEPDLLSLTLGQRLGTQARDLYAETHREVDRVLLARVLEFTEGSMTQAALILGIARQTLRLKLRELGLSLHNRENTTVLQTANGPS
jgi:DNA-binding NtrC family response regulator